MKRIALTIYAASLAFGSTALFADDGSNATTTPKKIQNSPGVQVSPASTTPMMTAQRAMEALLGKWEPDKSYCYKPSDTAIFAEKGTWRGYEWSCAVPITAYNGRGFAGNLSCSAEGEGYRNNVRVELAANGQSASVYAGGATQPAKLFKCPKETEEIAY